MRERKKKKERMRERKKKKEEGKRVEEKEERNHCSCCSTWLWQMLLCSFFLTDHSRPNSALIVILSALSIEKIRRSFSLFWEMSRAESDKMNKRERKMWERKKKREREREKERKMWERKRENCLFLTAKNFFLSPCQRGQKVIDGFSFDSEQEMQFVFYIFFLLP